MAGRVPLTVAVITLNEERNLDRCLRSVDWAAERIVVDAGSTDRTLEVAARHGARVERRDWPGYVAQKNFAASCASHDWVLSLDADEWLPDETAAEIRRVLAAPSAEVYAFPRRTAFCGAFLRHTWWPDWQARLYRRGRAGFGGGRVHESLRPAPGVAIARLRRPILHLGYRSLREYVERMNRYTDLAAESLAAGGARFSWLRLLLGPPAAFLKLYVLKLGFLDGVRGWVVAAGSATYVWLKYAKLWESGRPSDPHLVQTAGTTPEDGDPGGRR